MVSSILRRVIFSVMVASLLAGCSAIRPAPTLIPTATPPPTETPLPPTPTKAPLPEMFKTQVLAFLKEGAKLNAMTEQGVAYADFKAALADTRAEYDLAQDMWPAGFATGTATNMDRAFEAWKMTAELWELKLGEYDEPTAPNINGWSEWEAYNQANGGFLIVNTHPADYLVEEYRHKPFYPFDANISTLMTFASKKFATAKAAIIADMP